MAAVDFLQLPPVQSAQLTDVTAAVQGDITSQETWAQVLELFQSNISLTYAGNPNTHVEGVVGQTCWDSVNDVLWVCSTAGTSSTSIWQTTFGNLNNGQLIIGSNSAAPQLNTLIAGSNITITNTPGNIEISASGGGGGGLILPIDGGTGVSSPTAHTLPVAEGSSNFNFLGPLTNGQLLIGSTGNDPLASAITAGNSIGINNGPGFIGISLSSTPNIGTATGQALALAGVAGLTINGDHPILTIQEATFASNGTYTPYAGMLFCLVEAIGGGGGGGGCPSGAGGAAASGGGGGGYCKGLFTAAQIGASQAITIGAGGNGGAAGANNGSLGGDTIFGAFMTAAGGAGGQAGNNTTDVVLVNGGAGGASTGGNFNTFGNYGGIGFSNGTTWITSGVGGSAGNGSGGDAGGVANGNGISAQPNTGAGGGGAASTTVAHSGGNGGTGFVYVIEFCRQ
jgi:hypothetical protein